MVKIDTMEMIPWKVNQEAEAVDKFKASFEPKRSKIGQEMAE